MKADERSVLNRAVLIAGILWTSIMAGLCLWGIVDEKAQNQKLLVFQARALFQEVVTTRAWNASHGGVYVPVTPATEPNPHLEGAGRDVVTEGGVKLTKINPAYMTRQISEIEEKKRGARFHITSENPLRPANAPDPWEVAALHCFESGSAEVSELLTVDGGAPLFRYMAPLWVEESCLKCHAKQGYSSGDLRGGISVSVPAASVLAVQNDAITTLSLIFFGIWGVGAAGIRAGYRLLRREASRRRGIIAELQLSLAEVKTLSGLLPICAHCKRIRDDKGYWDRIESYIEKHSDAEFSHGICQDCMKELYPDLQIKLL